MSGPACRRHVTCLVGSLFNAEAGGRLQMTASRVAGRSIRRPGLAKVRFLALEELLDV